MFILHLESPGAATEHCERRDQINLQYIRLLNNTGITLTWTVAVYNWVVYKENSTSIHWSQTNYMYFNEQLRTDDMEALEGIFDLQLMTYNLWLVYSVLYSLKLETKGGKFT